MPIVRFAFKQDADAVYRLASDPEVVKARSLALGERDVHVEKRGDTVTNTRLVEAEIPAFAKKLFKPTNTVVDVKEWDASRKTARLDVDVKGAPVKISGTISIVPSGTGCEYSVEYKASCKIPLIGGKLEAFVESTTEKAIRDELEWNQKELERRG